jgi:DNA-directed RNA polymerase specialized sigma24 family protein
VTDSDYEALLEKNKGLVKWAADRVFKWRYDGHRQRGQTYDDFYVVGLYGLWRAGLTWTGSGSWKAYLCTALIRTIKRYSVRVLRHVPTTALCFEDDGDEKSGPVYEDESPVELPKTLLDTLAFNRARCLQLWHYDVHLLPDDPVERRRIFVVASHARSKLKCVGRERVAQLLGVT